MYVVTFYSFKGGVGRSLALANVGVELARTGRRVLLVDFDLEAPGLDTFNLPAPKPEESKPQGIVDFISRYLEDDQVPDFAAYHYESVGIGDKGGRLWIMPAGRQDGMYGERFKSINWQDLYDKHQGYLLIEDLKGQWRDQLAPDYVLVDSRTGHTDVAGICTRQLPDAVVVLFFPNKQNLNGLKQIVKEIRSEEKTERKKRIDIRFVMSNVPDVDDEDEILASEVRNFKEALGYQRLTSTIHHYENLGLIRQDVFTAYRPKSRLAREYRELTQSIVRSNFEDREAVLEFLEYVKRRPATSAARPTYQSIGNRLDEFVKKHPEDAEVLHGVAKLRVRQGHVDEAWELLSQAVASGLATPEGIKDRILLAFKLDQREIAEKETERFLGLTEVSFVDVMEVVHALTDKQSALISLLPDSKVIRSLDAPLREEVACELFDNRQNLASAERILRNLSSDPKNPADVFDVIKNDLVLVLIGQGKFMEAIALIGTLTSDSPVQDNFNYAMAIWGYSGTISHSHMIKVIEAEKNQILPQNANCYQCAAIAAWAIGDIGSAKCYSERSRQLILSAPRLEFSCWHYLRRNPIDFMKDMDEIDRLISGDKLIPPFMQEKHT
jgi:cellulose biosynthesis protein BcsQ